MENFVSIGKNKYKIIGRLTEEDINVINNFKNRTTLVLNNTVGLSSKLISKIVSDRVVFIIKGGLDYDTKEKYRAKKYIDRTFVSPKGLSKIIKYFEYNESMIDSNWNEFEKAMFLYNALVVDMDYAEDYENIQSSGTIERSLNGILYGKLVCAGFAQVYKEMLDRIGIKNYYQNQKDHHAFNIIEIDGKKYGLDITWDNYNKKNYKGKCNFGNFGNDPEFYNRRGHQLYREEEDFDSEDLVPKIVYDVDEEIFDLSLLSMKELNEYYSCIASKIDSREPFRYNLQDQPVEIKNMYLPVDTVGFKLKQEATKECLIVVIINFLKRRNSLRINPELIEAFNSRKGYVLDIGTSKDEYDLSLIGIVGYRIDRGGNVSFKNGNIVMQSIIWGISLDMPNIPQEELNKLYNRLNQYLNQYFNKYILDIINNLNELLTNYEYKPNEWDTNRSIESANIFTKLLIIVNSRNYLIQLGMNEEQVDSIIQRITDKHNEIHKPYEKQINYKNNDLDFLLVVFNDFNMVWKVIESDLQRKITDDEFISFYYNVDYMIQLFEKYIIIGSNKKFKFSEYSITKEDLQQLLNEIIQDYQCKRTLNESNDLCDVKGQK